MDSRESIGGEEFETEYRKFQGVFLRRVAEEEEEQFMLGKLGQEKAFFKMGEITFFMWTRVEREVLMT